MGTFGHAAESYETLGVSVKRVRAGEWLMGDSACSTLNSRYWVPNRLGFRVKAICRLGGVNVPTTAEQGICWRLCS